ncbi:hypothetical protein R6Q59_023552, partial [Mikania micrantha]
SHHFSPWKIYFVIKGFVNGHILATNGYGKVNMFYMLDCHAMVDISGLDYSHNIIDYPMSNFTS